MIGDYIADISQHIQLFSKNYDYVITCGGIGPTHDDVTYEGVAKAFDVKLETNEDYAQYLKSFGQNYPRESPFYKMAKIPSNSKLHYGPDSNTFPLVSCNNVYIMPGVPSLFVKTLEKFKNVMISLYGNQLPVFHYESFYFYDTDESQIAETLSSINQQYEPRGLVKIGSYPELINKKCNVKITVFSPDASLFEMVKQELIAKLPINKLNSKLEINISKVDSYFDEMLQKYNFSDICIAFNGGKDCIVILHLWAQYLRKKLAYANVAIPAIYIRQRLPFPEVERFIYNMKHVYNLELTILEGCYKTVLTQLKADCPNIKAIIMGTRKTDPFSSHLSVFTRTDKDWPEFMRVNPLLEWNYNDIWIAIDTLHIPYCTLYDKGYTSIGNMDDTVPNHHLRYIDEETKMVAYHPARKLKDYTMERNGRK